MPDRRGRILVAPPHAAIRQLLSNLLRGAGYGVISCADSRTAVAAVIGYDPDLLITDAHLERAEAGLWLLAQLRADPTTAQVGMIIFTADEIVLQRQRPLALALRAHLVGQPVDLDQLLALIQTLVSPPTGCRHAAG